MNGYMVDEFLANNIDMLFVWVIFFAMYASAIAMTFSVLEFKHTPRKRVTFLIIAVFSIAFSELMFILIADKFKIDTIVSLAVFFRPLAGISICTSLAKVDKWKSTFIFLSAWSVTCFFSVICSFIGLLFKDPIVNHIVRGVLAIIMQLACCKPLYKHMRKPLNDLMKTVQKKWNLFALVPGLLIFVHAFYFAVADNDFLPSYAIMLAVFMMSGIFFHLLIFCIKSDNITSTIQKENEIYSMQVQALETQLQTIIKSNHQMRIMRHDLKHYIGTIESLIAEKQFGKTLEYTNWISENIQSSTPVLYCKNVSVNACISHLASLASERKISLAHKIDIPENLSIDTFALCSVIANMVENAINHCTTNENIGALEVQVVAKTLENSILVQVKNPTKFDVRFDEDNIPLRSDGSRGTGIQSIASFARQNDAVLNFQCADDIFTANILINFKDTI